MIGEETPRRATRLGAPVAALALLFGAAACTPTDALRPLAPASAATREVVLDDDRSTSPLAISAMADIDVEVTGAFRPNRPIAIRAAITALRDIPNGVAEFTFTADDVSRRSASRRLSQRFSARAGVRLRLEQTLSFARPGYYSLIVSTHEPESAGPSPAGAPLARHVASKTIWILITEDGGRWDAEYRHVLGDDSTRLLTLGGMGAFLRRDSLVNVWKQRASGSRLLAATCGLFGPPTRFCGRVTYTHYVPGVGYTSGVGVPQAKVTGWCSTVGGVALSGWEVVADSDGAFSVDCPENAFSTYVTGSLTNASVDVKGYNNAPTSVSG